MNRKKLTEKKKEENKIFSFLKKLLWLVLYFIFNICLKNQRGFDWKSATIYLYLSSSRSCSTFSLFLQPYILFSSSIS